VRVGLLVERLPARARRHAETLCLLVALVFVGYTAWAAARFVYESWQFDEVAQGLIRIPIWIPQMSFALGAAVFLVAVLDELVLHLSGRKTAYQAAEDARRATADFSDHV
jgi:TRAP-type C4-dicarboxylate transport system permease small subunit